MANSVDLNGLTFQSGRPKQIPNSVDPNEIAPIELLISSGCTLFAICILF